MNSHLSQKNQTGLIARGASTAKALLESAQLEAQQIITQARGEAAGIIQQAKSRSLAEEERAKISKRICTIAAWRRAVITAKDDMLLIIECLTKSILQSEISSSPSSILIRIEAVNQIVDDLTSAVLELSEFETDSIKEKLSDFKIRINNSLTSGEFIIRARNAEIKSSPVFHLENLIKELKSSSQTFKQAANRSGIN